MGNYQKDHDYAASLDSYWLQYYKLRFPDAWAIEAVPDGTPEQRLGCDRYVHLMHQRIIVEEKNPRWDVEVIPVEYISNDTKSDLQLYLGWAERDLICNEISFLYANLFVPKVFTFPWPEFQQTWLAYKGIWRPKYGYKANTNYPGKTYQYHSYFTPVPASVLLKAIPGSTVWEID